MSEIQPIELSEKEKEFARELEFWQRNRQDLFDMICGAFRVPPELVVGVSPLATVAKWIDVEESINESQWRQYRLRGPDESAEMPEPDHVV